uniref:Disease resistance N-terminal domain-containing protein n=1 Tax=Setaria italica TaxID=4555 RepID=K3YL76_SETIT
MKSAIVSVSMGVMEPLLSKLSKLMEEEYDKLRGVSKQIKFLRDELRTMSPALEMLGDARDLNPLMRDWRNELRELAYDMEDCVDSFLARVDDHEHHHGGLAGILGLFRKFKKMVARHEIACQIEELKKRVMEVSERHKSPDVGRILRDIAKGVGLSDKTAQDDDEQQLIDKLREHLQDKR